MLDDTAPQPSLPPSRSKKSLAVGVAILVIGAVFIVCFVSTCSAMVFGKKPTPVGTWSTRPIASATTTIPSLTPTDKSPAPTPAPTKPTRTAAAAVTKASPISDRTWLAIARDPDAYVGKRYVIFGEITQADAATGTSIARANVGGKRRYPSYGFVDYPTNTILEGDLSKVVEGDLFEATVTVQGSQTYDTTLGGQTTVPDLFVIFIKVLGHVDA